MSVCHAPPTSHPRHACACACGMYHARVMPHATHAPGSTRSSSPRRSNLSSTSAASPRSPRSSSSSPPSPRLQARLQPRLRLQPPSPRVWPPSPSPERPERRRLRWWRLLLRARPQRPAPRRHRQHKTAPSPRRPAKQTRRPRVRSLEARLGVSCELRGEPARRESEGGAALCFCCSSLPPPLSLSLPPLAASIHSCSVHSTRAVVPSCCRVPSSG